MTDLDDALAAVSPQPEAARTLVEPTPRRHRHEWCHFPAEEPFRAVDVCLRCGKAKDEVRSRRGKSNRRLGADQERRIERVYGPRKVGEYGDPVDHLGRLGKWQSKSHRTAPPKWLAGPLARMAGIRDDLVPLLILSYVRQGKPTEDFVIVRGCDWLALHGRDEP